MREGCGGISQVLSIFSCILPITCGCKEAKDPPPPGTDPAALTVVRGSPRAKAPSTQLLPRAIGDVGLGKPGPRDAMLGHQTPAPLDTRQHTSTNKCFKMARFDVSQGGMTGGAGELPGRRTALAQGCWHTGAGAAPLPSAPGAAGRVGEHKPSI